MASNCSAIQIRKDYRTAQQAIYLLFSEVSFAQLSQQRQEEPRSTKGCAKHLDATKILKPLPYLQFNVQAMKSLSPYS